MQIPCPVSSSPGEKPQEGAGRLINCFAEKNEQGARFPVTWKRTPGLRQVLDITGHDHLRGGIQVASTLVVALDTRVYAVTVSGSTFSAANLGALAGTDRITVARNNAATPNIVAVTSDGCFNLFTGSAPTSFADADLPQPNSVFEHHGYFGWTIGDGRIFTSGLNAVTVATTAFTTEQSLGGLLRGVSFRDEVFAFGPKGTAVYRDVGASPFPFERLSVTIERGIAGTHAVAGWEDGGPDQLIWAADNGTVVRLEGYRAVPISSPDVARDVAAAILAGDGDLLEASVYSFGIHQIWSLTLPGSWTWEYNITTQNWHERKSYGRDDWRASSIIRAFDRWIAGDRTSGLLFSVDPTYYREANDPLVWELVTGVVANFPARQVAPRADFDFTSALGMASGEDPIQTDPTVLISWSDDGGYSYGNPVSRQLGQQGESGKLVSVLRTGLVKAKGRRFRLQVSDPVHVGFTGAQMVSQQRAA